MGVTVYREQGKAFSQGGRIQFTAPSLELKIVNRELGTVDEIASNGEMKIMLDSGKRRALDPKQYAHLDHGYAVTSHSSQGQTADRYQEVRSSEQIEVNTMFGNIGSEPATAASLRKSRRLPRPRSWDYGARTFCR